MVIAVLLCVWWHGCIIKLIVYANQHPLSPARSALLDQLRCQSALAEHADTFSLQSDCMVS